VIVEAILQAKFSGYRSVSWSSIYNIDPYYSTPGDYFWSYTEGGHLIASASKVSGVESSYFDPILPSPNTTGSVGFQLVGRRKRSTNVTLVDGSVALEDSSEYVGLGTSVQTSPVADGQWCMVIITNTIQALLDNRDSDMGEFFLWPANGSTEIGGGHGDLTDYLGTMMPAHTCAFSDGAPDNSGGFASTASGTFHWYSGLELGKLLIRFRVGDVLDKVVLPLIQPRMLP
jgi:hypothetical protein